MTTPFLIVDSNQVPWKEITVERSLDSAVGTFTARAPLTEDVPSRPGGRAFVQVGGEGGAAAAQMLNGFVDAVSGAGSASDLEVQLAGRDRTADMADGTRLDTANAWQSSTLLEIARDLAGPYGIPVRDLAGASAMNVSSLAIQPGESALATLERAARRFGVLLGTSPDGDLTLGADRAGRAESALSTGSEGNVRSWSWSSSIDQRFHRTRVLGANDGGFGQVLGGSEIPVATAVDPEVRSQRERVIVAQGQVVPDDCERLAAWHVSVARARSSSVGVELPSWRQSPDGNVWRPGLLVDLTIDELEVRGELLVAGVQLSFGSSGERAQLRLVRPESLDRDPSEGVGEAAGGFASIL
ncbi:MAG: hypothetical protein AAGB93_00580 [Planctomycetota bacterium]